MAELSPDEYAELFECLTVEQQQACARGEVDLAALVDLITSARGAELCPRCCKRPIRASRLDLCDVCTRKALTEACAERIAEVEAQREANLWKKRLQRAREAADVPLPRRDRLGTHEGDMPPHSAAAAS